MINFVNYLNLVTICWIIFILYWLVSAFFVKQSATKYNWKIQIIWRLMLIVIVIIFVKFDRLGAISFLAFLLRSFFGYVIIGTVLTVLGLIIAIWARISLGRNWSSYTTYKKEHELITTGPYRFLRHPIYSGMFLMLTGAFLYYGKLIILVIFAIASMIIAWRIVQEEKSMIKLFGKKYTDYMRRTRRLIPWIY